MICSMTFTSGLCDQIFDGLLIQPVSGLMGLAWQALSSAGVKPFWQALYESNVLDKPSFDLTPFQDVTGAKGRESGGVFTLGLSRRRFSELIMPR
jgi:cathepsin D